MPDRVKRKKDKAKQIMHHCNLAGIDAPWWVLIILGYKSKKEVL